MIYVYRKDDLPDILMGGRINKFFNLNIFGEGFILRHIHNGGGGGWGVGGSYDTPVLCCVALLPVD
jgi:hypothetical protein